MRDLTMHELDAQLAEQLPARELMQSFAIGAAAVNFANVDQSNSAMTAGPGSSDIAQANVSDITQTATAMNSGPVTALSF